MSQLNTNIIKGVQDNDDVVIKTNNTTRVTFASGGDTLVTALSAPSVSAVNTCKVWLNYDHVNDSLKSSFNVSSVNDDSAGNFTINFATPFPNSEYVVTGMGNGNNIDGNNTYAHYLKNHSDMATGSVKIVTQASGGTDLDLLVNCIAIHGN